MHIDRATLSEARQTLYNAAAALDELDAELFGTEGEQ
jgi:hypothetical protein